MIVGNFCDIFNLSNIVHSEICFTKNSKPTIDLFLTNKPLNFKKTLAIEIGVRGYHKMITAFFKAYSTSLRPKEI